jgi:hypothetical protein
MVQQNSASRFQVLGPLQHLRYLGRGQFLDQITKEIKVYSWVGIIAEDYGVSAVMNVLNSQQFD